MRKSGYRVSDDSGNKTENVKRRHDEANQDSGGRKGPCNTCQFTRKSTEGGSHCVTDYRQVMTVLQPFVMNRLNICRQRTTSLLAITPEKDTHAQNREHVPSSRPSPQELVLLFGRIRYYSIISNWPSLAKLMGASEPLRISVQWSPLLLPPSPRYLASVMSLFKFKC